MGRAKDDKITMVKYQTGPREGLDTLTRYVDVEIKPGRTLKSFYWLQGQGPYDTRKRVEVQHHGQPKQCFNCLESGPYVAATCRGCVSSSFGKLCKEWHRDRAYPGDGKKSLLTYLAELEAEVGYVPFKTRYERESLPCGSLLPSSEGSEGEEEDDENIDDESSAISEKVNLPQTILNLQSEGIDILQANSQNSPSALSLGKALIESIPIGEAALNHSTAIAAVEQSITEIRANTGWEQSLGELIKDTIRGWVTAIHGHNFDRRHSIGGE